MCFWGVEARKNIWFTFLETKQFGEWYDEGFQPLQTNKQAVFGVFEG